MGNFRRRQNARMKWRGDEDVDSQVSSLGAHRTPYSHSSGPCSFSAASRSKSLSTVYSRTGGVPGAGSASGGSVLALGADGDPGEGVIVDRRGRVCASSPRALGVSPVTGTTRSQDTRSVSSPLRMATVCP